jgi:UDP-2-acetamido-3-amino-2,3-dideoxy-glucuronate N-acetyltransferase
MGNPARQKGWMSRHAQKLPEGSSDAPLVCPESGLRYREARPGELKCIDLDEEDPLPLELRNSTADRRTN